MHATVPHEGGQDKRMSQEANLMSLNRPMAPDAPGVLLTFDDQPIDRWCAALALLDRFGAKATFFVPNFDELSPAQVRGLRELVDHGHAVGCHGLRHRDADQYARRHGSQRYIDDEIVPALEAMRRQGFEPTSFAYPMGRRSDQTDAALRPFFRHVRTSVPLPEGQSLEEFDPVFTPVHGLAGRFCLPGKGVDSAAKIGIEEIRRALTRAVGRGEILTLYAHSIGRDGKHHWIEPELLEAVLAAASGLGLRFYRFDDLP